MVEVRQLLEVVGMLVHIMHVQEGVVHMHPMYREVAFVGGKDAGIVGVFVVGSVDATVDGCTGMECICCNGIE